MKQRWRWLEARSTRAWSLGRRSTRLSYKRQNPTSPRGSFKDEERRGGRVVRERTCTNANDSQRRRRSFLFSSSICTAFALVFDEDHGCRPPFLHSSTSTGND
jgi:hypothetical protein